ncbi:hypothetical protein [Tsukamurella sp. 1534]|uniref:hypothetical protein n=1 Tax=Tsukamurella sp. 1534 TaxID=1151061 RepID=UPI00031C40D2|nr:hypothetical protein [Tsukamurella sp. 1534]
MPKITHHIAAAAAGFAIVFAFGATPAATAEPASIEDASGTGPSGAAQHEDGSGTPGPSFDDPIDIPSVGDAPEKPGPGATPEELEAYQEAVKAHEAAKLSKMIAEGAERARKIAKVQKECTERGDVGDACW